MGVKGRLMFFLLLGDRDQLLIAQPMDEKEFRENLCVEVERTLNKKFFARLDTDWWALLFAPHGRET